MGFSIKLWLAVAVVWLLLSPPLFTGGACTEEFEKESAKLTSDQASLQNAQRARAYWGSRNVPYSFLSPEACRQRKPRTLDRCRDGPLVIAKVPVRNAICRLYRDDEIAVWLQYDSRDRLSGFQMNMSPYKSLPIPFTKTMIHWAR